MADRGNIFVTDPLASAGQTEHRGVFLYTHRLGGSLPEVLASALLQSADRLHDAGYLNPIIVRSLIGDDPNNLEFGISVSLGDNEHPILVVDHENQQVYESDESDYAVKRPKGYGTPFADFAATVPPSLAD